MNNKKCKADINGQCSFDCEVCCYESIEFSKHFRNLWNNQIIK